MPNPKKKMRDTPEYRELVANLRKIIEEAAAKGVVFGKRDDTLTCRACGCYENVLFEGDWVVCDREDKVIGEKEFIVLDRKERGYRRNKVQYYKIRYDFICSQCGARQQEIVRDRFED